MSDDRNKTKEELFEKFKTMSEEDLLGYKNAGKFINAVCSVVGIGLLLAMMLVQTLMFVGTGLFIVYFLSNVAAAASQTVKAVEKSLERFE